MRLSDAMGEPEFRGDEIVVSVSQAAFVCTECGVVKKDMTSTFSFYRGKVLCDPCLEKEDR